MANEEIIEQLNIIKDCCYGDEYEHTTIIKGVRKSSVNFVLGKAIEALKNDKTNAIRRDVWELYQRHQSHLGTYVYEFGIELKELLNRDAR